MIRLFSGLFVFYLLIFLGILAVLFLFRKPLLRAGRAVVKYFRDWIERDRRREEARRKEAEEEEFFRKQALEQIDQDPSWKLIRDIDDSDDQTNQGVRQ